MIPNYLIIRGNIFADLTSGPRNITLISAHEFAHEAETVLAGIASNAISPEKYYIIKFHSCVEVFMKPAVCIHHKPDAVIG